MHNCPTFPFNCWFENAPPPIVPDPPVYKVEKMNIILMYFLKTNAVVCIILLTLFLLPNQANGFR